MKNKTIIISIVLLSLCLIFGIYYFLSRSDNIEEESLTEIKTEEIQESDITTDENIVEEKETDNSDEVKAEEKTETTTKASLTKDSSNSKTSTSSNDTSTSSSSSKESSNNTTTSKSEETTETQTKTETTSESSYIGVPDPNSPFYVYHRGTIEYSTMEECLKNAEEISFKDTEDILNTTCVDVVDSQGTILGEYLYIKCNSGNCNKYK